MLKELEIYDFGTYVEVITQIDAEQQYRMWFRGQSDYSWGLVPSVQRKDGMGKNYEQYISTNFMIHTMRLNPNAPQRYDRASWLTLMQHAKHQDKGYTANLVFRLHRSDGSAVEKLHTAWTHKGRKFLYHELKRRGILPMAEQEG